MAEIREMGRATQGVTLINVDEGTKLSGLQRIVESDADNGENGESSEGGENGDHDAATDAATNGDDNGAGNGADDVANGDNGAQS